MRIKRDFIFDPGLVLYLPLYKLDGVSFMSKDAYGHLCTVTGALWRPYGRWFDGTDDLITVPDTPSLQSTEVTILCWANPSALGEGAPTLRTILEKQDAYFLGYDVVNDSVYAAVYSGAGLKDVSSAIAQSTFEDNWWFLGITSDGTNIKLYVNGLQEDSGTSGAIDINTNNVLIGAWHGSSRYWKGLIAEILIYNRALTPLEIQHNYLATKWRYR